MEILKDWKDLIPFGGRFQYYGKNKKNEKELKKKHGTKNINSDTINKINLNFKKLVRKKYVRSSKCSYLEIKIRHLERSL